MTKMMIARMLGAVLACSALHAQPGYGDTHDHVKDDHVHDYVFDSRGRLISQPPGRVQEGDTLHVEIAWPEGEGIERLIRSIEGLDQSKKSPFYSHISDPAAYRAEWCKNARHLVSELGDETAKEIHGSRLDALSCAIQADSNVTKGPSLSKLVTFEYEVSFTCQSSSGSQTLQTSTLDPVKGKRSSSKDIPITKCARLDYEIRRVNPYPDAIATWLAARKDAYRKLVERWDTLRPEIVEARAVLTVTGKRCDAYLDEISETIWTIVFDNSLDEAQRKAQLQPLLTADPSLLLRIDPLGDCARGFTIKKSVLETAMSRIPVPPSWIQDWLWLTEGVPSPDPLVRLTTLETQLAEARKQLGAHRATYQVFEKLADNQDFSLGGLPHPGNDQAFQGLAALGQAVAKAEKQVAALEQQVSVFRSRYTHRHESLHRGLILLQPKAARGPVMRHHDATQDYILVDRDVRRARDIDERERAFVLLVNTTGNKSFRLETTVTPITEDLAPLTQELGLSAIKIAQPLPPPPTVADFIKALKDSWNARKQWRATLSKAEGYRFTSFPRARLADPSANYRTQLSPHDAPPAPAVVEYAIHAKEGDKETQVGKHSYRQGKRYRARIKTGLLYSGYRYDAITLQPGTDGMATSTTTESKRRGVDGTFGVQVYTNPDGRNIRTSSWYPVAYVGLSMRAPLESAYLGAGFEPVGGVTLIVGGLEIGRGDAETKDATGAITGLEDEWGMGYFGAVLVDAKLLASLFGLKMDF